MSKRLNYGLINKKSRGYRKALRQCKKNKRLYGASFDNSETWYLDNVFYKYCKDHNFFKHKKLDDFADFNYEDKIIEEYEREDADASFSVSDHWPLIEQRIVSLTNEVNQGVLQNIDDKQREELCKFLVPRIKAFKVLTVAYPLDLTWEEWEKYIQDTIDEMEQKHSLTLFLNRIHDFVW